MKRVVRAIFRKFMGLVFSLPFYVWSWLKMNYLDLIYRTVSGRCALHGVKDKGNDCVIYGPVSLKDPCELKLGDYVRIGEGAYFFCKGGLEVGENTQISRNCTIYTANHKVDSDTIPYGLEYDYRSVKIGKSVWIGMNVNIAPGVTIGDGAIIGMGMTVSKDVAAGEIVVGGGQRVVGNRDLLAFEAALETENFFGKKY